MSIDSQRALEVTREKLDLLEKRYETLRLEPAEDQHVRQLTMGSLKKLMNQMKEEIVRYEVRQKAAAGSA